MGAEGSTAAGSVLDVESAWEQVADLPQPGGSGGGAPGGTGPLVGLRPPRPLQHPLVTAAAARRRRNRLLVCVAVAAIVLPIVASHLPGSTGAPAAKAASSATKNGHHVKYPKFAVPRRKLPHRTTTTTTPVTVAPTTPVPAAASSPGSTNQPSPATSTQPSPAKSKATGHVDPAGVPAKVANVAVGIIKAIDQQSKGRYDIRATAENVLLLSRWMANEGGLWADNPLNTSLYSRKYPHQFTSSGVDTGIPIYPSMNIGIEATATTLLYRMYGRIVHVLEAGDSSCLSFAKAVIDSPWASSHYGYDPHSFCQASPASALQPGHGHHRL